MAAESSSGPAWLGRALRFDRTEPGRWVALVLRLGLAAVWLAAGFLKIVDLDASVRSVYAFQIMPRGLAEFVGTAQPVLEIALGLALLVGVMVRLVAVISAAMIAIYIVGIISVAARGLRIDCGCFGGGGALAANQSPHYGTEILRDVGLLVLALLIVAWPRSRFSLDSRLLYSEEFE